MVCVNHLPAFIKQTEASIHSFVFPNKTQTFTRNNKCANTHTLLRGLSEVKWRYVDRFINNRINYVNSSKTARPFCVFRKWIRYFDEYSTLHTTQNTWFRSRWFMHAFAAVMFKIEHGAIHLPFWCLQEVEWITFGGNIYLPHPNAELCFRG